MDKMQLPAYDINIIKDEARYLIETGRISRKQPIYSLCKYIPAREWSYVEATLENNNFLLRDRIGDLIGYEVWNNDWSS